MKTEEEIEFFYRNVEYDVNQFHKAIPEPRDHYGNRISQFDNMFNEGMLEALKFVLDKRG